MSAPLISIIVPIYQVETYLRKCVESILQQTYVNIEVILVDDGSPDGCSAICEEYVKIDGRVIVIHQRNKGVSSARNAGLDVAKGDYISFVDGDDWVEQDYIEVLYDVMKASGADLTASYDCIGDIQPEKVKVDEFVLFSPDEAIVKMLRGQFDFSAVWGKLFTKDSIENRRFSQRIAIAEDVLFFAKGIVKSKKVAYIPSQSYHYVIHPDSATHAFRESFWSILNAMDMIIEVIRGFDSNLGRFSAMHVINMDLYISKMAESKGKFSKDAYEKVMAHIRRHQNKDSWKSLSFKQKCWVCLLLCGRNPFIAGRRCFRIIRKIKRDIFNGLFHS